MPNLPTTPVLVSQLVGGHEALSSGNQCTVFMQLDPWMSGQSQSGMDSREQQALAFGNRSAVLFELGQYQKSIHCGVHPGEFSLQ